MKSILNLCLMGLVLTLSGCNHDTGDGVFVPAGTELAEKRATVLVPLFTVTTDAKPGKRYQALLQIDSDSKRALKLYYRDNEGDIVYDLAGLNTTAGLVLLEQDGHKVVRLRSGNFRPNTGGDVQMVYLRSGISGAEGVFNMEIVLEGQNWLVYANDSAGRRTFRNMFLRKNTVFGKTVGIASVSVSK